jgi:hypothetical protein
MYLLCQLPLAPDGVPNRHRLPRCHGGPATLLPMLHTGMVPSLFAADASGADLRTRLHAALRQCCQQQAHGIGLRPEPVRNLCGHCDAWHASTWPKLPSQQSAPRIPLHAASCQHCFHVAGRKHTSTPALLFQPQGCTTTAAHAGPLYSAAAPGRCSSPTVSTKPAPTTQGIARQMHQGRPPCRQQHTEQQRAAFCGYNPVLTPCIPMQHAGIAL